MLDPVEHNMQSAYNLVEWVQKSHHENSGGFGTSTQNVTRNNTRLLESTSLATSTTLVPINAFFNDGLFKDSSKLANL